MILVNKQYFVLGAKVVYRLWPSSLTSKTIFNPDYLKVKMKVFPNVQPKRKQLSKLFYIVGKENYTHWNYALQVLITSLLL